MSKRGQNSDDGFREIFEVVEVDTSFLGDGNLDSLDAGGVGYIIAVTKDVSVPRWRYHYFYQ